MEDEDEELQFRLLWEKRQQNLGGVIAMMGLPCTRKTDVAFCIGHWAKCPVLCIDHFLCHGEQDEEKEIQQHKAFAKLCKAADFYMSTKHIRIWGANSTMVIKSRLNSTFELQQLLQLITGINDWSIREYPLLIIEFRVTNEFLWKNYFDWTWFVTNKYDHVDGYKGPQTWAEMEKARDDYYDPESHLAPPNWDLHLQQLMSGNITTSSGFVVRRLVMDPFVDSPINSSIYDPKKNDLFDAITFIFSTTQEEFMNITKNPYTVELRELRPYLLERRVRNTLEKKGRSLYLCRYGNCIFEEIHQNINDVCGVCGKQEESSGSSYACRLCTLTLHKLCAERIDFKNLKDLSLEGEPRFILEGIPSCNYVYNLPNKYGCKYCIDNKKGYYEHCGSCAYQTHLKCGVLPTVLNHDSHQHFLSLILTRNSYICMGCRKYEESCFSYCCRMCNLYYHLRCATLPLELLKHNHGGHEHSMKLVFSRQHGNSLEDREESYWCDVCYGVMDPQAWLYICKCCPYYSAHLKCADNYRYFDDPKNAKFVRQLQNQLEGAMEY